MHVRLPNVPGIAVRIDIFQLTQTRFSIKLHVHVPVQVWNLNLYIRVLFLSDFFHFSGSFPDSITVSGPRNLNSSSLQQDDRGRAGVKFADLTWAPTTAEKGVNVICLKAFDGNG